MLPPLRPRVRKHREDPFCPGDLRPIWREAYLSDHLPGGRGQGLGEGSEEDPGFRKVRDRVALPSLEHPSVRGGALRVQLHALQPARRPAVQKARDTSRSHTGELWGRADLIQGGKMGFQRNGGPEPAEAGLSGGHLGFALLRLVRVLRPGLHRRASRAVFHSMHSRGRPRNRSGPGGNSAYHRFFSEKLCALQARGEHHQIGPVSGIARARSAEEDESAQPGMPLPRAEQRPGYAAVEPVVHEKRIRISEHVVSLDIAASGQEPLCS